MRRSISNKNFKVYAKEVDNFTFGGYKGVLSPSPPHADNNPKRAIIVEWSNHDFRFVFWHEASYVPFWVWPDKYGGFGMSYQHLETPGDLMQDYGRMNEHSYAEILEKGPEKVVIRWRYDDVGKGKTCNPDYRPYYQETYYFYPNGLGLREAKVLGPVFMGESMEMILLNPVGHLWWDSIEGKGKTRRVYSWIDVYSEKKYHVYWKIGSDTSPKIVGGWFTGENCADWVGWKDANSYISYMQDFQAYGKSTMMWKTSRNSNGPQPIDAKMTKDICSWDGHVCRVHTRGKHVFSIQGTSSQGGRLSRIEWDWERFSDEKAVGLNTFSHWPIGWINSELVPTSKELVQKYPSSTPFLGLWPENYDIKKYYYLIGVTTESDEKLKEIAREWLKNPDKEEKIARFQGSFFRE